MPFIADASWMRAEWWPFWVLPALAAVLGGVSNCFSLRLLFGPTPLPGFAPGLLVRHCERAAQRLAATLSPQLPLRELFRLMEPEKIAGYVSMSVMSRLDEHIDSIMVERHSVFWANLPRAARQRVYSRVKRQLPSILDNTIEDMGENIDELVDIRQLIDSGLSARRDLLARLLEQALEGECRFLIKAGLWSGLLLGVLQAAMLRLYPSWWWLALLPAGIAAGAVLLPRALLFWPGAGGDDGLSRQLRHDQPRLVEVLARGFIQDLFGLQRLMQEVLVGARSARTRSIIRRHMRPLLEAGMVRTTIQVMLGIQAYAHIKQVVVERLIVLTSEALSDAHFSQQRSSQVESAARAWLAAVPPQELHGLVQSVLDEGLWQRVLAVSLIGLAAGGLEVLLARWLMS